MTVAVPLAVGTGTVAAAAVPASIEYRLDLRLAPEDHRIEGTVALLFPSPAIVTTLRLAPQAEVRSVRADGHAAEFTFRNGRLDLPENDQVAVKQLHVEYTAIFNDPFPVDTIGIEDPSYGVRASIVADGVFLAEGVPWFPQLAGVRGRHRVRISAPVGMVAVTAGHFDGCSNRAAETVSEWTNDFPLAGLALSAGRFQIAQEELESIQLLTFLSAENAGLAPGYLSAMRRHLTFYRELLGPYPFAKFAVVENFLPTGFGLPSWTLLGSSVVRLPFLLDTSLPHEIVHSWWGNAVEIDAATGNWAEGLTTYLADYLLKERTAPKEALDYRRKLLRDYAALVAAHDDFPLHDFTGRMNRAQQAIGYGKGAMVFHMLRRQIGDAAFRDGLRQMAMTGLGRSLGWLDLERIFSSVSGADLDWFFRQWVDQAGAPELAFHEVNLRPDGNGWAVDGIVRQSGPSYRLEMPLRLTTADGAILNQSVSLTRAGTSFRFVTADRPLRLEGDPDVDIFRRLTPDELPPTVNDLTNFHQPLVVVADGQQSLLPAAHTLIRSLRWNETTFITEAEFDPATHAHRDLLLLGRPRRTELRSWLPADLTLGEDRSGWQWEGETLAGDALFAVVERRQARQGARSIFLARSPAAAGAVAAKISHYGRYSLLLFDAGRNLIKSTREVERSPLIVSFPKES